MLSHPSSSTSGVAPVDRAVPGALTVRRSWSRQMPAPIACVVLAGAVALGLVQQQPPAPVDEGGPGAFSVRRAMSHVERIAVEPRPAGSRASADARAYIRGELGRLHLPALEQHAFLLRRIGPGRHVRAQAHNVLARLSGRTPGRAVLLMAHYDSAHNSPGAADNASGVATLLEAARALQGVQPLGNDVIFLFTDSEESNLAGAEAFVTRHAWARDVAVVLNFEARGMSGPSMMFEAPGGNGWVIRQMARSAPFPRASSVYDEIYRRMPNATDMDLFKNRRVAGLNFAFIERPGRYHTSGDTPSHLDRASLYHHGSNAVSLARALANADLGSPTAPDAVYFTAGNHMVVYPQAWRWILAALATVILLVELRTAVTYRGVTWGTLALAAAGALAAIGAACGAAYGAWRLMYALVPAFSAGLAIYINAAYAAGVVLTCVAAAFGMFSVLRRRASRYALVLGGCVVGVAVALVATAYAPGASYAVVWPSLAGLAAAGCLLRWGDDAFWRHAPAEGSPCRWRDAALAVLPALPAAVLVAPIAFVLFLAFGMGAALPVAAIVSIALALAAPALLVIAGRSPRRAAIAAASAAAATLVAGALDTGFDPAWPKPNSVFYARDLDAGRAAWVTRARSADSWTSTFLGRSPQRGVPLPCLAASGTSPWLHAAAPLVALSGPTVRVVRNEAAGDRRVSELLIESAPGAGVAILNAPSANPPVFLAAVGGVPVGHGNAEPFVVLNARAEPGEALLVRFETQARTALRFTLIDALDALPRPAPPRPPEMVRSTGGGRLFSDTSLTCRTIVVAALAEGEAARVTAVRPGRRPRPGRPATVARGTCDGSSNQKSD